MKKLISNWTDSVISGNVFTSAILVFYLNTCMISETKASHNAGLDISYECLGGNDSFLIRMSFYRDCDGINAPANLTVHFRSYSCGFAFASTATLVSSSEIIPYCTAVLPTACGAGAEPSREQYIYETTVTLPGLCPDWVISADTTAPAPSYCCRNNAISTLVDPSVAIYVEATLDNTMVPCNSSPFFTNPPAPFVYANQTFCYNNGAVDLNGDSLAYSLYTPRTGPNQGDTVVYIDPPYTYTQPLSSTPTLSLDAVTGDICMTPTVVGEVTVLGLMVKEYRYGQLIGTVMRDIQITVIAGADQLPYTNGINGTGVYMDTIAAGCSYSYSTDGADPDVDNLTLASNVASAIPGATFTVAGNGTSSPTGTFNWTPGQSDISNTPTCFVTRLRDDACQVNGEEYKAWCFLVVDFSAYFTSTAPSCVGEEINFYSQYYYAGYNYLWDFGSGVIASYAQTIDPNPTGIRYATSGAKTVILSISSPSGCIARDTAVITISPSPTASFTNTVPSCQNNPIDFTNTGSTGTGIGYVWDFGNGATPGVSFAENPSGITYGSGGDKVIFFQVSNQFGCTASVVDTLTVSTTPIADFSNTPPTCTGSVDFFNMGTSGATYSWNLGSGATPGTSTLESPQNIVYSTPGTKTITLITTLGSCSDTSVQAIVVAETPAPSFTHNAPQCEGVPINFTYIGTTGTGWTFLWDFGVGANPPNSSQTNPQNIIYGGSGSKTVLLTVSNGVCSATSSQTFSINQKPLATFSSTAPTCTGDSVDFLNTGTTGASYSWNFGSGATPATSTTASPQNIVYSTAGIKTVTLITTLATCTDTSVQTINIYQTPAPSFTHNAPQCEGVAVNFTYTGTNDTNWTFLWDFGVGGNPSISSQENPQSVIYYGAGTKTILLTVSNAGCSEVTQQSLTINQKPVATYSSTAPSCTGDDVDFLNTGTSGASYSWNLGSGASPSTSTTESPQNVTYSSSGIKTVTLITTLATCTDTSLQTINIYQTPAPSFTHNAPQCEGVAVNFTYTGTNDTNWTFLWDFGVGGNPSISSQENPQSVIYYGAGTKTILLTVSNTGCSEVTQQSLTINQKPVATYSSTAPSCTGDSVDFLNTGTSGALYYWNLGSGATPATSTTASPQNIVYSASGIKTVTFITTLATCTDTSVQTINITETPAPSFTTTFPAPNSQCEGAAVDFTYTGSSDTNWTYTWDFGVGATPSSSILKNPLGIVYSGSGSKAVLLTVANGLCSEVAVNSFTVNQTPVASFTSNSSYCTGDSVDFQNTGTSGAAYLWSFGSFSAPASSVNESPQNIVYLTGGIKTVTLIATLGSCTDTSIQTINITETPAPSFIHNAPQCKGAPITFTYTGTNDTNWTFIWDFGFGATPSSSSQQNPPGVTYNGGGSKTVLLTVINGLCSEVAQQTINIYALPVVNPGNDTTICANTCVTIGSASVSGLTYNWKDPDNTLSQVNIANPVACPEGIITVYHLTVTDTAGCQNRDSVNVVMLLPLKADAGVDVEICFGDSVQIGTGLIEGQFYSWSPSSSLDNATMPNPVAKPDSSTTYTLMVMDDYGCTPVMDEVLVTVHPLPDAEATDIFGSDTSRIMPGSSIGLLATGGLQYVWFPAKGLDFDAIENPVATPDSTIDYIVTVTDIHGCINTDTVRIDVADSIVVFIPTVFTPDGNGTNDILFVRGTGKGAFIFRIFDRWGGQIFISDDPLVGWNGNRHNSGEALPEGAYVYSYEVTDMDGKAVKGSGIVNLVR